MNSTRSENKTNVSRSLYYISTTLRYWHVLYKWVKSLVYTNTCTCVFYKWVNLLYTHTSLFQNTIGKPTSFLISKDFILMNMDKFLISFFNIFNCRYLWWSKCKKNYVAYTCYCSVMHIFLNNTDGQIVKIKPSGKT